MNNSRFFTRAALALGLGCVLVQPLAAQRASVSGAEVTGTFRAKGGNEFKILALGKGKLQVEFNGVYAYKVNGEMTANMGFASGIAKIEADKAVFKPEETDACTIVLTFSKPGELKVEQEGDSPDCGFGHNVNAVGTYRKVSARKPVFGEDK